MNYVLNITFATPPIEIRQIDIKIFKEPQFTKISKMIRKFFFNRRHYIYPFFSQMTL